MRWIFEVASFLRVCIFFSFPNRIRQHISNVWFSPFLLETGSNVYSTLNTSNNSHHNNFENFDVSVYFLILYFNCQWIETECDGRKHKTSESEKHENLFKMHTIFTVHSLSNYFNMFCRIYVFWKIQGSLASKYQVWNINMNLI